MTTSPAAPKFGRMTVEELEVLRQEGRAPRLIDVRERHEWEIGHIEGAELRPLSEIESWWRNLDPADEIVLHCHHGRRSEAVCRALAAEGFTELHNLEGGIDAWAQRVDEAVPRY